MISMSKNYKYKVSKCIPDYATYYRDTDLGVVELSILPTTDQIVTELLKIDPLLRNSDLGNLKTIFPEGVLPGEFRLVLKSEGRSLYTLRPIKDK